VHLSCKDRAYCDFPQYFLQLLFPTRARTTHLSSLRAAKKFCAFFNETSLWENAPLVSKCSFWFFWWKLIVCIKFFKRTMKGNSLWNVNHHYMDWSYGWTLAQLFLLRVQMFSFSMNFPFGFYCDITCGDFSWNLDQVLSRD
jgi:hypothetical protein